MLCWAPIETAVFAAEASSVPITNPQAPEVSLRQAHDRWLKVLEGDDVNAIMSSLTEDAMVLSAGEELISGREALRAHYKQGIEQRNEEFELHVSNIEAVVEGDLGYTLGTYTITDADGDVVHRGKYLEIWRKQNAAWKLSRDIANSSSPAQTVPAASEPPSDTREPSPAEARSER